MRIYKKEGPLGIRVFPWCQVITPATNASSERYFSALRRIKTYLRNTMRQERLNHLMLLYVHKDQIDLLNLCDVGNYFVCGHENRLSMFEKFLCVHVQ